MDRDHMGWYLAAVASVGIVSPLTSLGLPMVLGRYVGPYWQQGRRQEATELAATIFYTRFLLSFVAAAIVGIWCSYMLLTPRSVVPLLVSAIALFRYLNESARSELIAIGKMPLVSKGDVLYAISLLPLSIICYSKLGLAGFAWSHCSTYLH